MTRVERFKKSFFNDKTSFDACLVTSRSNRFYLTDFSSSDGIVLLTTDKSYLIVDFRYYEMAKSKVSTPFEIILADGRFSDAVEPLFNKHCIKRIWIEDLEMSVSTLEIYKKRFSEMEFLYIGNALTEQRAVKDEREIELIKKAQKITDSAFVHILNYISEDKTEKDVALELEFFMRSHGSDGIAFDTISVSGAKSSLPHGTPSDILLTKNSFIGKADEEMKKVYNTVLEAQRLALCKIKSGVLGSVVDAAARDYIYSKGYEGCFGHSTGHGLGIEVHESPSFSPNYKISIPEGCILSVEPGIYLEGEFGVRIEDIVVVREFGCENLTNSPKHLIEI